LRVRLARRARHDIGGVAKPTARTLRLPALHQPRPEMVAAATFILHVMSGEENANRNIIYGRTKVKKFDF
jgi:hypothetical protein